MAKIHKNAEKFPIKWNGTVKGGEKQNDNIPSDVNIVWGGRNYPIPYESCHGGDIANSVNCTDDVDSYFFEDFDVDGNGSISVFDAVAGINAGAPSDFTDRIIQIALQNIPIPPNGPTSFSEATETEFTWGDVSFIQEIMDGIGSGSRRARQNRLNKLDKDKKKRLIHLICRVKGEKVYDDYTEIQDVEVKVDDVELIAETILKRVKLEIKENV
tara:strand:- start:18 stop:659 length:642 start_codon:yes stop_codon:yes gene_type:complete